MGSDLATLPKRAPKVSLNDSVYKDLVFAFLHFFGLQFPHGESDDSQLRQNATRNSEKRNAFRPPFLTVPENASKSLRKRQVL